MIPSLRQLRANYHSIGRQGHNPEAGILPRVMDPIRISVCLNNIYKTSLPTPTCVSQQFIVLLFSNMPVNSLTDEAALLNVKPMRKLVCGLARGFDWWVTSDPGLRQSEERITELLPRFYTGKAHSRSRTRSSFWPTFELSFTLSSHPLQCLTIESDEMRAFIVCADNEPEWLLYDGWAGAQTREELSKLIRLSRLLLMDFLCYQKYTRCQHQDLEIQRRIVKRLRAQFRFLERKELS